MALDKTLKTFNVERQAYYGGTFVGNHVHRALKVCILFFRCAKMKREFCFYFRLQTSLLCVARY